MFTLIVKNMKILDMLLLIAQMKRHGALSPTQKKPWIVLINHLKNTDGGGIKSDQLSQLSRFFLQIGI